MMAQKLVPNPEPIILPQVKVPKIYACQTAEYARAWRAKNRDHNNAYHREYRKRKKERKLKQLYTEACGCMHDGTVWTYICAKDQAETEALRKEYNRHV
jgi:hypothetical protein